MIEGNRLSTAVPEAALQARLSGNFRRSTQPAARRDLPLARRWI
jgi:hypothetical protein